MQFQVQVGDQVLKDHLKTTAGNALYTSKTIQNQMITICVDVMRRKLLVMVQRASFFSVIADEAADIANDEQLSILLTIIHHMKSFLALYKCQSGVTGEKIANDILSKLVEWQLQPYLLCGEAYDVAGAMAGKSRGVASCIISKFPVALYPHFSGHRLTFV